MSALRSYVVFLGKVQVAWPILPYCADKIGKGKYVDIVMGYCLCYAVILGIDVISVKCEEKTT